MSFRRRAVLTHRQSKHLPKAPDFEGPLKSIICLKIVFLKHLEGPKIKRTALLVFFSRQNHSVPKGIEKQTRKLGLLGPSFMFCLGPPKDVSVQMAFLYIE